MTVFIWLWTRDGTNLERIIIGQFRFHKMNVSSWKLLQDPFLCCRFVAHEANDQIVRVDRELAKELKLQSETLSKCSMAKGQASWKSWTYPDSAGCTGDEVRRHGW